MPSFLTHQAAMENVTDMLSRDGIQVITGNIIDNFWTDKVFDSHGYSIETGQGSILTKIEQVANEIRTMNKTDLNQFSEKCRHICHFCTDSMSIGQISNQLWGKYDNRFDALGETVSDKRANGIPPLQGLLSAEDIKSLQLLSMRDVYDNHINQCRKWNYCATKQFRSMIRDCVYKGSYYAYMWIKLAVQSS